MRIIGICDIYDSCGCIFENSKLVFTVNEKRQNRQKLVDLIFQTQLTLLRR